VSQSRSNALNGVAKDECQRQEGSCEGVPALPDRYAPDDEHDDEQDEVQDAGHTEVDGAHDAVGILTHSVLQT
jgi:hypothetical protein